MEAEKEKREKRAFRDDGADFLLSVKEAAERLRTSDKIIKRLINAGLLKSLQFRREHRIPKSALNRFIGEHLGHDVYEILENAEGAA